VIPFNNLKPQYTHLQEATTEACQRVLHSGWFILGPEVEAFENAFAAYHNIPYAVGVANGTDAIELALRAAGIGQGDEVITVAHTAVATVSAIERAGAKPVLVDIDPNTYTMNPSAAEAAITSHTRAIIPVHLYGQPADLNALCAIKDRHHLLLIEDCAQAHGARFDNQLVGTFGDLAAFSFYPTKNLGALGDGGAVITRDRQMNDQLRLLRNYGQTSRYKHAIRGINSRLDEMQAAILQVKLTYLDAYNSNRRETATLYGKLLETVKLPQSDSKAYHVYHLYVIQTQERNNVMEALMQRGVGTLIHYPVPVHRQAAYLDLGYPEGSLPITEMIAQNILSLPLYWGLSSEDIQTVALKVNELTMRGAKAE
jgi:dTDP-3-amino-3,4,6-trideoxy-alpha-D-glucose transaminase